MKYLILWQLFRVKKVSGTTNCKIKLNCFTFALKWITTAKFHFFPFNLKFINIITIIVTINIAIIITENHFKNHI